MYEVILESTRTLAQAEFARFAADHERRGGLGRCELLNGRILMTPPAGYPHGKVGSKVQFLLVGFVSARRLGEVFDSSQGFELPSGDIVEPDHSVVSPERWAAAPPPEDGKFLRVVPDLIVEVLSTRTASQDRGEKKAIYERNGVREYWLVDPRAREMTVFLLREGQFDAGRVIGEDGCWASMVLDGLQVEVRTLLP